MSSDIDQALVSKIKHTIQKGIDEATEAVVQQAVKDFETRLRKEIALAAMSVEKFYDVANDRRGLVITVKQP